MKLIPAFVIVSCDNKVLTYDDVRQSIPEEIRLRIHSLEDKYLSGEIGVNGAFTEGTRISEEVWRELSSDEYLYIAPIVIPQCDDKRFLVESEVGMTFGLNSRDVDPNWIIVEEASVTATTFIHDPHLEDGILVYAKPSMVFYKDSAYWGSMVRQESLFIPGIPSAPTPPWVVPQPMAQDIHQFADKPQDIHQFADKTPVPQDINKFADVPVPGYEPYSPPPQQPLTQPFPTFGQGPSIPAPASPAKTVEEANREMLSTITSMFPMFR